eukprot:3425574-Rhodomonas_salina.2
MRIRGTGERGEHEISGVTHAEAGQASSSLHIQTNALCGIDGLGIGVPRIDERGPNQVGNRRERDIGHAEDFPAPGSIRFDLLDEPDICRAVKVKQGREGLGVDSIPKVRSEKITL